MELVLRLIVSISIATAGFVILVYIFFKEIDKRRIFTNLFLALIVIWLALAILFVLRIYIIVLLAELLPFITIVTL